MTYFDFDHVRIFCCLPDRSLRAVSAGDLPALLKVKENTLWIDAEKSAPCLPNLLEKRFGFHPLAIEDCLGTLQRPKVEAYPDYLFLSFPLVVENQEGGCFTTVDISFFWGPNYIVSVRGGEIGKILETQRAIETKPEIMARGPDFLMEQILHRLFEESSTCLQKIQHRIEGLEERIFQGGGREDFSSLFQIRNDIVDLRHVIESELEIFGRLGRGEFPQLCEACLPYLRDIHDHIWRMNLATDRFREWVAGLLGAHQARLAEKTNEVMKLLTIIATTLLPLGVITGFFGMNFATLPGLQHPSGWFFAFLGMLSLAGGMLWFFKRKGWL